ncbi:MAG: D-alanyl-D-alanine carboxypeptidase [Gammaproteobacteria bacterium]
MLLAALFSCALSACFAAQSTLLGAVVIDAESGAVLHASNANRRVRPASLTKVMTALLVMQHLAASNKDAAEKWTVSVRAAAQPASRLGLRAGREMNPSTVLDALLVPSANDAAVVAAEAIADDEAAFAQRMNDMAARLGLTRTRFANASGLPAQQFTTARDIAVLARYLWQTFPSQRARYAQTGITYAGRWVSTTNPLLGSYRGARGMKTGFTCRAGFHLLGIVERNGRTLIAVVLGARTRETRSRHIRTLLDDAFAKQAATSKLDVTQLASAQGQGDNLPTSTTIIAAPCLVAKVPSAWSIDVGIHRSEKGARKVASDFIKARRAMLRGASATSIPRYRGVNLYRAIVTGLDQDRARTACLEFRKHGGVCVIFGPDAAAAQREEAARIRALVRAYRATRPNNSNK